MLGAPLDDLDLRLDKALRRRGELAAEVQRIEGQRDAAQAALKAVEDECRAKKIDPDQIDVAIEKVTARYTTLITQLEQGVREAETALAPFIKE